MARIERTRAGDHGRLGPAAGLLNKHGGAAASLRQLSLKQKTFSRWRRIGPGVALAGLVGAALLILPPGRFLQRWSFDLLSALKPAERVDELVLVYIDDLSHTRLRQPYDAPWDRALDARLVDRLRASGARAIGFDVLFDEPGRDPAADAAFAESIRQHGNVILGATLSRGDYFGLATEIQLKVPATNLLEAARGWGFVELEVDPDDAIRRHYAGPEDIPSLSWRLATMLEAPSTRGAGAPDVERWMNYYGPGEVVPAVSYFKVLDDSAAVDASFFRGKVVLVGAGSKSGYTGKRKDQFRNPYTWLSGRFSPGVEVHAISLLNLLRADWLRRPTWWAELGGLLVTALGLCALVDGRRPRGALLAGAAGAAAIFAVAGLLLVLAHTWTTWLIPVAVQLPLAWAWALARGGPVATNPRTAETDGLETREFTAPTATRSTGPHVPDLELLEPIGRGAYGEVWRARTVTGQERAVKVVERRNFGHDRQFEREFQGVVNFEPFSRLHPGLVQVLHVGRNDPGGYFYYVMELADDEFDPENAEPAASRAAAAPAGHPYRPKTLASLCREHRPQPAGYCLRIALEISSALAFLHSRQRVHRDIKPANIIFVDGCTKLADIGLVAEIDDARTFVGTEGYIAPEGPGSPAADIFSAGRVLYELLTGREVRQFPEGSADLPGDNPVLRDALMKIVRKAGAPDLAHRYDSVDRLRHDLEALRSSLGTE